MTELHTVLANLRAKDVRISVQEGSLALEGPKGALSDEDIENIRVHKAALITFLQRAKNAPVALLPRARPDRLPLSRVQQRLWYDDQFQGGGAANHIATALRLRGALDTRPLIAALDAVFARHEILRATFDQIDGEPVQLITQEARFPLQQWDLSGQSSEEQQEQLGRQAREEIYTTFDLRRGPLIRGRLLQLAPDEHVLMVTLHHIIADGWSLQVLSREVGALYAAYRAGKSSPLTPIRMQYVDYVLWEREWLQSAQLQRNMAYWQRQWSDAPGHLELMADKPPPVTPTRQCAVYRFPLSSESSAALRELARTNRTTLFMTLLGIFQILIARVSGERDVVVPSAAAGRDLLQVDELMGPFYKNVTMRTHVEDGLSFAQLMNRVKKTVLDAYAHQDVPLEMLGAQLQRARSAGTEIRCAVFSLERAAHSQLRLPDITVEPVDHEYVAPICELGLFVEESDESLRGRFQYSIDTFSARTVEQLSRRFVRIVEQVLARPELCIDDLDLSLPIAQMPASGRALSMQQVMWVDQSVHPEVDFNLYDVVELRTVVDHSLFEQAIQRLVDRTTALRVQFQLQSNGLLRQDILDVRKVRVPLVDLSGEPDPAGAAQGWITAACARSIDPTQAVPFNYTLLKLSHDRFVWFQHHHHLIVDLLGQSLLTRRLLREYSALTQGDQRSRPRDTDAYLQYLHRDAEYRYTPDFIHDRRYWTTHSNSAPAATLSIRTASGSTKSGHVGICRLPPELAQGLGQLALRSKISLPRLLIAAVVLYLSKMTGLPRLCIGLQSHGRIDDITNGLVATCSRILPVQFDVDEQDTLADFLAVVGQQINDSTRHGRFSVEDVRRMWRLRPQDPPLYNIIVNVLPYREASQFTTYDQSSERSLRIFIVQHERDDWSLDFSANPVLYESWEIEMHAQRFAQFVAEWIEVPESACMGAALLVPSAGELARLTGEFNATCAVYPSTRLVNELFEDQASNAPAALAVIDGSRQLTYGEINQRANRLARYLRALGVRPDQPVAICVERSIEMVIGLLAILKAGGAYLPLDPSLPVARLAHMLSDSAPVLTLSHAPARTVLHEAAGALQWMPILDLEADAKLWQEQSSDNLDAREIGLTSRHLAYIIYTSGSTGRPKAVMTEHRALVNRLWWMQNAYGLEPSDAVLQKTPFSFDVSVWEFFWTLMTGARLVMARPEGHKDPRYLQQLIAEAQITTAHFVPSMLQVFLEELGVSCCTNLRRVICSGEELSGSVVKRFATALPGVRLFNLYGPTEAAIDVTAWTCDIDNPREHPAPPIGRPIWNTQIYILDQHHHPVPIGVAAELYIGGVGLARGYLHRPDLTAERFVANPFREGERMYRTGDLARLRPDGVIEFLGRNDFQVKIRGNRIELGEIEARLLEYPQVRQAVVLARDEPSGDKRLVAYYTHESAGAPDVQALKAHLSHSLPSYMVPAEYVLLPSFPMTSSGKLDRIALAALQWTPPPARDSESAEGEIEQALAGIWKELLQVAQVGRHDSFFDLGGHSLLAARAVARVQGLLEIDVPVRRLFENPTLAQFADSIIEQLLGSHDEGVVSAIIEELERQADDAPV